MPVNQTVAPREVIEQKTRGREDEKTRKLPLPCGLRAISLARREPYSRPITGHHNHATSHTIRTETTVMMPPAFTTSVILRYPEAKTMVFGAELNGSAKSRPAPIDVASVS